MALAVFAVGLAWLALIKTGSAWSALAVLVVIPAAVLLSYAQERKDTRYFQSLNERPAQEQHLITVIYILKEIRGHLAFISFVVALIAGLLIFRFWNSLTSIF